MTQTYPRKECFSSFLLYNWPFFQVAHTVTYDIHVACALAAMRLGDYKQAVSNFKSPLLLKLLISDTESLHDLKDASSGVKHGESKGKVHETSHGRRLQKLQRNDNGGSFNKL